MPTYVVVKPTRSIAKPAPAAPSGIRREEHARGARIVEAAERERGLDDEEDLFTPGVAEGHMIAPLMSLVKKAGRAVVTAVAPMTQMDVQLNLFELAMMRKELVGCIFGNANPRRDIPRLLNLYMEGKLLLDELVTTTYELEDINQGYQDMRDGVNIRGVVTYS